MKKKNILASVTSLALLASALFIPSAFAADPDVNGGIRPLNETRLNDFSPYAGSRIGSVGLSDSDGLFYSEILGDMTDIEKDALGSEWDNQQVINALGINVETDTIKNSTEYSFPGKLETDAPQQVANGEHIQATYTLDASLLKKTLNTWLITSTSSENAATHEDSWNTPSNSWWKNSDTKSDPELAFIFDLPSQISATSATASVSGLDGLGFNVTTTVDGQKLRVNVRKSAIETGSLVDLFRKINSVSTVTLTVNNLTVQSVTSAQDLSISAQAYGEYSFYATSPGAAEPYSYGYWAMGAQPNPATTTVHAVATSTVTFINKGQTYASVTVPTGSTLNTENSMPANPTTDSQSTFRGWNTSEDGSGQWFTGDDTVNGDVTVYAVYDTVPVVTPTVKPTPKPAKKTTKPKVLSNTGADISIVAMTMLALLSLGGYLLRRRATHK
ncbi:hypothetical protein EJ419_03480 [Alloscardovia theropitheci]|uniref:LPXTG cell wall anchor domain-containing protein n=1 Tax=Alloscardovia theropitheci TaxID=2496842 RepID=A0A4R0QQ67_9BIFI|nr:InlB B-repeat-containing protein [Alloscardovia theropitheci]TCD54442.1 hypothetical protein EJ419_03480 [Alloscardovia theropitheci]